MKRLSTLLKSKTLSQGLKKTSAFQDRVFESLLKVPRGKVTTYRDLAQSIDCASPQAVGQALKRNPYAPQVPCHRVIKSDLSLGGFFGQRLGAEIEKKQALLKKEGVLFENGRLKEPDKRIMKYPSE